MRLSTINEWWDFYPPKATLHSKLCVISFFSMTAFDDYTIRIPYLRFLYILFMRINGKAPDDILTPDSLLNAIR